MQFSVLSPPASPSYLEKSQSYKSLKSPQIKSYTPSSREIHRPSPLLNMPAREICEQQVVWQLNVFSLISGVLLTIVITDLFFLEHCKGTENAFVWCIPSLVGR